MVLQRNGRSAFTLIELLVVIGLLAVLATISVVGYGAASRGMADRGTVQSVASALRVVQQTCQIDRVPTKVLFCNERLTSDSNKDDATLCQGMVIGIKQAGRITVRDSECLVDEFADWQHDYSQSSGGSSHAPGMSIYRMDGNATSLDQCRSIVRPSVTAHPLPDELIKSEERQKFGQWCEGHNLEGNDVVWGLKVSGGLGASEWKLGEAYGVEIVRIGLPKGYIFGKSAPGHGEGVKLVSVARFSPDKLGDNLRPILDGGDVQISLVQAKIGGAFKITDVGKVDSNMLKDD